jgi:hypothetical protein
VLASASGQPLPSCSYLPARLQPPCQLLQTIATMIATSKQQASKWSLLRSELHRNSLLLRILQ